MTARAPQSVTLYEVIAEDTGRNRSAFGQTFTDHETAARYAATMRKHGYSAAVSPKFGTMPTLAEALNEARSFFEDQRLGTWTPPTSEAP
jgi:hypothetical protein